MEKHNRDKVTYTKEMLIKKIAEYSRRDIDTVRIIYNSLEDIISKLLSTATNEKDVSIRLFKGIAIDGIFVPKIIKVNNLTGKIITSMEKIKLKVNVTRSYSQKITNMA